MATPITPARNTIYIEETDAKSAISEATMQRIGAAINYITGRIFKTFEMTWNGYYKVTSITDGQNGFRYFDVAVDLTKYILTNHIAGSSGTSAINFDVYDENNVLLGDLFSIPPSISSGAGNRSVIGRDIENSQDINAGTNKVVGTLNYTTLQAGWSISPKITSAQVNARNLYFELQYKEQ